MDLKLNQKLIVGYVFIVFLPVILFSSILFILNYQSAEQANIKSQNQEMTNFKSQFHSVMDQISNYSYFFQNNTEIMDYLDGQYTSTSDVIYNYVASMSDTFKCYSYDNRVSSITIYGMKDYILTFSNKLESLDNFHGDRELIETIQKHINGYWIWSSSQHLTFYKTLYDKEYHFPLGILEINTSLTEILGQLTSNLNYSWYFRSAQYPSLLYSYSDGELKTCSLKERDALFKSASRSLSISLEDLPMELIQPVVRNRYAASHIPVYLLVSLAALSVFTCLYYFVARSLTKRLVDFNHFISIQQEKNLSIYPCPAYTDEVGSTITAYNQLIQRINRLIHNNYEVSLKMKEAQYYALQAQIKPHFLYNILENIRMSSESHGDLVTSRMTAIFGKYMRYAMNTDPSPADLETELASARDYLEVNKIRMGEKLNFSISIQTELDHVKCPRFVLQPLLENSIKHSWQPGNTLDISIVVTGEDDTEFSHTVYIQIRDNGVGIPEDKLSLIQDILYSKTPLPHTRHVGLRNVNDRLKAYHPEGQGMEIANNKTKGIFIQIPLIREEQDRDENFDRGR